MATLPTNRCKLISRQMLFSEWPQTRCWRVFRVSYLMCSTHVYTANYEPNNLFVQQYKVSLRR
jgi:hypothetical protein